MSTATPPRQNALNISSSAATAAPMFVGEQRAKAIALLGAKVSAFEQQAVLQLVRKDPTLILESVPLAGFGSLEFPHACMKVGLTAGWVFAVNAGYDINSRSNASNCATLLQRCIAQLRSTTSRSDVSMLLAMGASPSLTAESEFEGPEPLLSDAMRTCMSPPDKKSIGTGAMPEVIFELLEAGANPVYSRAFECPLSILVASPGWSEPDSAKTLLRLMMRLVKAGAPLDAKTGPSPQTPLQRALGRKNGPAIVGLVHLGADTTLSGSSGRSLIEAMEKNGLGDFIPEVQSAQMRAAMNAAQTSVVANPELVGAAAARGSRAADEATTDSASESDAAPASRRRRLNL